MGSKRGQLGGETHTKHETPLLEVTFKRVTNVIGGCLLVPLLHTYDCLRQLLHYRDLKLMFFSDTELVSKHGQTYEGNSIKALAAGQSQERHTSSLEQID